jgi:hypothetical protein
MIFRPAESSKRIVEFYRNYLLSTFQTNVEEYNKQFEEQLQKSDIIAKGPFLNLSDAYLKDASILDLIDQKILHADFAKLKSLHLNRKLYKHQVDAITKVTGGKNVVVSSGTGSGKTECFLIPIINHLLEQKSNGLLTPGIRALMIYPMNALVNDQIFRLRQILADIPEITFGRYTGETKESYKDALNEYHSREHAKPLDNELISREQMRKSPPHILITNYSMLEYLLLRPDDHVFFNPPFNAHWRYLVLDEAHSYHGAKGIEVSMLLRRVKAKLNSQKLNYVLTSATLGEKEDNPKVVEFASVLCSAPFFEDEVIRSEKTIPMAVDEIQRNELSLFSELAREIRDNSPKEDLLQIIQKYSKLPIDESMSTEEILYYLILHDDFYYKLRQVLATPKTLEDASKQLEVEEALLSDYIAVASNAEKDGDRIFEAKYHLFIKGIEGVFVTLAPSNKLFLQKRDELHNKISDRSEEVYKVFEITFCYNCNVIFIIGMIEGNKLIQPSVNHESNRLEAFMLVESEDVDEEIEKPEYYHLCSICGSIQRSTAIGDFPCNHDRRFFQKVLRVGDEKKQYLDELHACPSCGIRNSRRNILLPFYLSQDLATAIIATALYKELPEKKISKKYEPFHDFFGESGSKQVVNEEKITKQFLTFSDSRQSAAFFSPYLSITYKEALTKRLMSEVASQYVHQMSHEGMSLKNFVQHIEELMDEHNINDKDERNREAWLETLKEMSNFKSKNALQNLGILYFEIEDISDKGNEQYGLSKDEVNTLFKLMASRFLAEAAVSIPIGLTRAHYKRITISGLERSFEKEKSDKSYLVNWLPKGKINLYTKFLSRLINAKDPKLVLEEIWDLFVSRGYLSLINNAYKVKSEKIKVRKPDKLFICSRCKKITPYNIRNFCIHGNCYGELMEYDFTNGLKNPHYRNLYTELSLQDMKVREHTAQLSSDCAYQYQNEFKDKKINILSCSTTFEMGVDIGTLETIFLRNMPPSPANYIQRAGRAGRSTKSAAYALTYCLNNSHDLNFFKNPLGMIQGVVRPPYFNISNQKICIRHIFASAFSFFWQKHKEYYAKNIGDFHGKSSHMEFLRYLDTKPEDLKQYLLKIVPEGLVEEFQVNNFGWITRLHNDDLFHSGTLDLAMKNFEQDLADLSKAHKQYSALEKKTEISSSGSINYKKGEISRSIRTIQGEYLIDFLSRFNLIPKYGFPVDTVELRGFGVNATSGSLRLSRDLLTAISEFAPGSEIIANGKIIRSRYLKVIKGYSWPRYKYAVCDKCQTLSRVLWTDASGKLDRCSQCGQEFKGPKVKKLEYVIPKFGFVMDIEEPLPAGTEKPKRTYRGSIAYIGDGEKIDRKTTNIGRNEIVYGSSQDDSLLVLNETNFFVCKECGFGEVSDVPFPSIEKEHKQSNGFTCSNKRLTRYSLGHEFKTDVLLLQFLNFDLYDYKQAWTILYSILEGISKYLNIDRNELSGCLHWYNNSYHQSGNYSFVLFDNTPGGAGHVRQVKDELVLKDVLLKAQSLMNDCTCGGEQADTVCYGCLCNYYNQKQHDLMKRKYAIDFFNKFFE